MKSSPPPLPSRRSAPCRSILARWYGPLSRPLWAAALAFSLGIETTAQVVTSSGDAVITQQYSGPPAVQQQSLNFAYGPSLGPGGRPPESWYNGGWGKPIEMARPLFEPFFLPAVLPVLGVARPPNPIPLAEGYPREFAGEPFFMAYGNLAARNELSPKRADRIARYRTARLALLTELREQLNRVHDASTEVRQRVLAGFAPNQTARLQELETEAQQIRYDLTHAELFSATADDIGNLRSHTDLIAGGFAHGTTVVGWAAGSVPSVDARDLPPVHAGPKDNATLSSLRLMLSAAYFRNGFSPDQRRLFEEMAQEAILVIKPELGATGPAAVFFWPAGARIALPTGLAPEAAAKLEEFQKRKTALKNELRAALAREEKRIFNVSGTETFERLAAAQAPRFAELDALADQIRPALAAQMEADTKLATELPADLASQITRLVERKTTLQRELYARLWEFRLELPTERFGLIKEGNGLALTIVTTNTSNHEREPVLARVKEFNEEMADRFTALAVTRDRVREALARYQATAPGVKSGTTVDQLAADFLTAYQARETQNRQRDYAAAVLAPGLSPAQRRLLLAAATADTLQDSPLSAP